MNEYHAEQMLFSSVYTIGQKSAVPYMIFLSFLTDTLFSTTNQNIFFKMCFSILLCLSIYLPNFQPSNLETLDQPEQNNGLYN